MNTDATIAGLVSAAVLTNVPDWMFSFGEKLLYGALLAFITGFAYAAGAHLHRKVRGKT